MMSHGTGRFHQVSYIVRFVVRVESPTRHDLLEFQNIGVFRLLSNDEFVLGSLLILGFLSSSGLELMLSAGAASVEVAADAESHKNAPAEVAGAVSVEVSADKKTFLAP